MIRAARLVTRPARYLAGLVLPPQCVLCRRFADSTGLCAACWMDPPPLAMVQVCPDFGDGLQLTPFLTSLMTMDFVVMTDGEDSLVVLVPLHRQCYFR